MPMSQLNKIGQLLSILLLARMYESTDRAIAVTKASASIFG